jgi:hypothetical protein
MVLRKKPKLAQLSERQRDALALIIAEGGARRQAPNNFRSIKTHERLCYAASIPGHGEFIKDKTVDPLVKLGLLEERDGLYLPTVEGRDRANRVVEHKLASDPPKEPPVNLDPIAVIDEPAHFTFEKAIKLIKLFRSTARRR